MTTKIKIKKGDKKFTVPVEKTREGWSFHLPNSFNYVILKKNIIKWDGFNPVLELSKKAGNMNGFSWNDFTDIVTDTGDEYLPIFVLSHGEIINKYSDRLKNGVLHSIIEIEYENNNYTLSVGTTHSFEYKNSHRFFDISDGISPDIEAKKLIIAHSKAVSFFHNSEKQKQLLLNQKP